MSCKKSLLAIVVTSFLTTLRLAADCSPVVVVSVPPSACKSGTATAAVVGAPGATYAWTVDGGQITGDAAGDQINIALGTNAKATVSVTMTAGGCVSSGSGVIALHDPFNVSVNPIPAAHASEPLTIFWTYENGSPAQQTISGGDFGTVTLPLDARSYTYTPQTSGSGQFVIDAAMVMPANTPPANSRRRSVAKTPAAASICTSAHASALYTVGLCVAPPVVIDGPDTVVTGTTFQLSVRSQAGAVATWTISNGSPATATGDTVMVTAGSSGTVDVSVYLTRGACVGYRDRSIAITAKPVCNNPKATVSAGPVSCGSAIVNASFSGTPPFSGSWSDYVPFNTYATSLARTVTSPGNYSIVGFEDAICAGTSSGVAVLPALAPTATIVGKMNSCTGVDTVTVQFTGEPPFSGRWLDNSSFVTNDMQIVKTITDEGLNTLSYAYDGTDCRMSILGGVIGRPTQKVHLERFCESPDFGNVVLVEAPFSTYFTAPLTVTWSDGFTATQEGMPVYRVIQPLQQTTTYTIVSAHDAYCEAIFDGPTSVTVYASPIPDFTLGLSHLCTGVTAATSLATPPPADATVNWFIEGDGAIVSGQGTSSMQYKTGDVVGPTTVGCTFTFPDDRCPTSKRVGLQIDGDPVGTILLDKAQIHAGETAVITFTVGTASWNWALTDSLNDSISLANCGPHITCQALYTSSHGPGQSTIKLELTGYCNNVTTMTVPLTIVQ